jgi:membrane protease YdiL (CAAX protease family)
MHPVRALLVYVVAVFSVGPLLAPRLYKLAVWAGPMVPGCGELAQEPFRRFVHRALLGVALVGLWPLARGLGLQSWQQVGWVKPACRGRNLLWGFGLGLGSLWCVGVLALACGARRIEVHLGWDKLLGAVMTAGVVSVLEETLFRGVVFGVLRQGLDWRLAAGLSSVVYALVHCFQRPVSPAQVSWFSGFVTLGQMLEGFVHLDTLLPAVVVLTLAGAVLAMVYQHTGTLYGSVGLHAGWIVAIRLYGGLTEPVPGSAAWFWGGDTLKDGWAAGLALAVLLGWVALGPKGFDRLESQAASGQTAGRLN